ncbi:MAG: hypothetical protein AAF333_09100 [Planctomycetota bacterium]
MDRPPPDSPLDDAEGRSPSETEPHAPEIREAWALIQQAGYVAAQQILDGLDPDDLNVATPLRLARNLAALEVHRPGMLARLVRAGLLGAMKAYPLARSAAGDPIPSQVRDDGKAVRLTTAKDPKADAAETLTQLQEPLAEGKPFCLADLVDGYLVTALAAARPTLDLGEQRIDIVEPDPQLVTVCLMLHDWSGDHGPIVDPRFAWYVGSKAMDEYEQRLVNETMLEKPFVVLGRDHRRETMNQLLVRARQQTAAREARWQRRIDQHYADFNCDALTVGQAARPKVLLITCRFTTVLQHSTADCEQAFRKLGWRTRKLIEPSDTHRMTTTAVTEALATFRPDLVFAIDQLRSHCYSVFPERLPFVCWIQDQLRRLTNPEAGASIGPRDFVLSMVGQMYINQWGYPARQIIETPKLTRPPVRPTSWTSDGDDIVYVSNASQTLDALLEPFAGHALMTACARAVVAAYDAGSSLPTLWHIGRIVDGVCAQHGVELTPAERVMMINQLVHPLNNALYRQQALRWVADLADEKGLRFAVYGDGWDEHPDFARFARGPVAYGPELEKLTRQSKINLQIVPSFCLHQRLLDGLVAGGFFLVRTHPSDILMPRLLQALDERSQTVEEALANAGEGRVALEALLQEAECLTDLGMPIDLVAWLRSCQRAELMNTSGVALPQLERVAFEDAAGLRERVEAFLDDDFVRADVAETQRLSVEQRLSYTAGLRRAIARIGRLLWEEQRDDPHMQSSRSRLSPVL